MTKGPLMRPGHWVWFAIPVALAGMAGAWSAGNRWRGAAAQDLENVERARVRRADLKTSVVAGGDLQPTRESTVVCQVEDITDSDGTLILSMVDNGKPVKKGEELCRLDSSELEDLAREEEILDNQAKSAWVQAQLALDTAKIALLEYQDGLVTQLTKEFEGRIALGRSDTQRQLDRVKWTEHMLAKGYASQAQLSSERQSLAKAQHELRRAEGEYDLFRRFQASKQIVELRREVSTAEHDERVEAARFKVHEERLAYIRKQIDRCIVRAPQDGIAIHARRRFWRQGPLEPGVRVYEGQELFKLPDLSSMDVVVSVNESMGPQVKVGMRADVRIASLRERVFPGRVTSITPLSDVNWKEWDERVRQFTVRVRLDTTPPRLLPLMSASVEVDTGTVENALVVPVSSMTVRHHQQLCYVVVSDGLECRGISTRHATMDLVEVTSGLREGEYVVLHPEEIEAASGRTTPHGFAPGTAVTSTDRHPPTGSPAS
jgi:HlyD family secretion protein